MENTYYLFKSCYLLAEVGKGAFTLGALLFSWAKVQGTKSEEMGGKARTSHLIGAKNSAPIWKNQ